VKIFNYYKRLKTFLIEVRGEFKKVTWPPRREVYGTTIVVIITVFFFGFYLYGLDVAMSYLAAALTRLVGA
jgi:preprotein translocase subunit SecE